jgi:3-phosphoshikimate 1-carboxyvinyltransferase
MAMAFAVAGLVVRGIRIEDPVCVTKTFPEYFRLLESLR